MKSIIAKDTDQNYIDGLDKQVLQDYKEAIEDFTKIIENNPNHPWAYNDRGEAKRKLNDYTGAIEDHTVSIENYPTHTRGYICRGYTRYKLGDKDGACSDWNKAGEMGEKDAYYLIKCFIQ